MFSLNYKKYMRFGVLLISEFQIRDLEYGFLRFAIRDLLYSKKYFIHTYLCDLWKIKKSARKCLTDLYYGTIILLERWLLFLRFTKLYKLRFHILKFRRHLRRNPKQHSHGFLSKGLLK